MLGIQVAIGALNDVVDAPLDAVAKPHKPVPAGLVERGAALAVAGGGAVVGLALSAISGPATLVVGAAGLALGWAYDLRLSRTWLSWLPLTLALPLLPVHAWLGTTGTVPAGLVPLGPVGVLAGAGLALANGIVDAERDAAGGRNAIVVTLGRRRAWIAHAGLLAVAASLALALAPGGDGPLHGAASPGLAGALSGLRAWGLALGCAGLAGGAAVLLSGHAAARERGWELEAAGVAALAIGWLSGLSEISAGG